MKRNIKLGNSNYPVEYPTECPVCHHHGEISARIVQQTGENKNVEVVYQCAFHGCKTFFVGYYGPYPQGELKALKPQKPELPTFSEAISSLSPGFVEIFGQAEEARHFGLSQIAGPGYRKAFEFLIKDYAKSKAPNRSAEIEAMFAGKIVKEFVQDPRIEAVAKRALWLGNDETHYLKKWEAHDVNDLITLIKLGSNWIEIESLSAAYQSEMPE
jgi:hypothetical protein